MKRISRASDPWYSKYYDLIETGIHGDVAFYSAQAREATGSVLELGCGTGRITIPIASAGARIVGLDIDPAMLIRAESKVAVQPQPIKDLISFVLGDMTSFSFGELFELIVIPFRGFQNLLSAEQQLSCLKSARAHLASGGRIVFDVFDPNIKLLAALQPPYDNVLRMVDSIIHPDSGSTVVVWEIAEYDLGAQILNLIRRFETLDDYLTISHQCYSPLRMRYAFRFEMENLFERAELEVVSLFGSCEQDVYSPGREQVWILKAG